MGDDIIATNGRKTSGIAVDIEQIDHIVYGMKIGRASCRERVYEAV